VILLAERPPSRLISENSTISRQGSRKIELRNRQNPKDLFVIRPIDRSKPSQQKDLGFSLIEVLLVIVVISVLAVIAIPQFISYRNEAIDAQLKSDLRNAAVAIEAYYAKKSVLPASLAETEGYGFQSTAGVTISLLVISPTAYQLTASKAGGSQPSFTYDSSTGGIH
jgi:type IV pilus assembly protein PilA